jgi:hypothetical protein
MNHPWWKSYPDIGSYSDIGLTATSAKLSAPNPISYGDISLTATSARQPDSQPNRQQDI